MAVPDTDDFTLNDVVTEIGADPDLQDCFAKAIPGNFDPAYSGDKNSLYNFRNYKDSSNTLVLSPNSLPNQPPTKVTINFAITSNTDWSISTDVSWATVSPTSGNGNDPSIEVVISANTTSFSRTFDLTAITSSGTPVISDKTTIVQNG